jgi:hypothetical protein
VIVLGEETNAPPVEASRSNLTTLIPGTFANALTLACLVSCWPPGAVPVTEAVFVYPLGG